MSASHPPESIPDSPAFTAAGVFRRLASGTYDALILLAIWMVATLCIMPFVHSRTLEAFYAQHAGIKLAYQLALLALGYAFFGGFWTHGGQTVGMRTWNLRAVSLDGTPLNWYRALIRYFSMLIPWLLLLLGCEFFINAGRQPGAGIYSAIATGIFMLTILACAWPAFDPRHLAWHDRLSGTCVLFTPRTSKSKHT